MKIELKNYLHKNEVKYCLVGKIKGLAEENKRANHLIKNKKYREGKVWILYRRRDALGVSVRYHLLAYAYLSGKHYSKLEGKCRDDNKPKAKTIFDIVKNHLSEYSLSYNKISEESIAKWLEN